jgi:hypothetical protein
MGLFNKRRDPISEKARALEEEIQKLETEINKLSEQANKPRPHFRSSTLPGGRAPASVPNEPLEEVDEVDQGGLKSPAETAASAQFNELGVRKYDLAAAWNRLKNHFKAPAASNPKLVNYLAAGSIQGLRPLRYEKRVARNRFLFLVIVLFLVLVGIVSVYLRHR